jgi:hypothetical protein
MPAFTWRSFQPLCGSICYANGILGQGNNSKVETVLLHESSMPTPSNS